jgi:hypothetical protein
MTSTSILAELQKSVPDFQIDPDWLVDGLSYPIFNDFARFICSEAEASDMSQVATSIAFLDRALREGDESVRLLVFECLETLASCDSADQAKKYFGPETNAVWLQHFSEHK